MGEYRTISGKDFFKAKPSGELDLEGSKKMLASIALITKPPADYEILLDFRETNYNKSFTRFEVFGFVKELVKNRSAFQNKIAILSRDGKQLDNSKFAELCATNRGLLVKTFLSFENAVEWLTDPIKI
jgi:hypothetical protein